MAVFHPETTGNESHLSCLCNITHNSDLKPAITWSSTLRRNLPLFLACTFSLIKEIGKMTSPWAAKTLAWAGRLCIDVKWHHLDCLSPSKRKKVLWNVTHYEIDIRRCSKLVFSSHISLSFIDKWGKRCIMKMKMWSNKQLDVFRCQSSQPVNHRDVSASVPRREVPPASVKGAEVSQTAAGVSKLVCCLFLTRSLTPQRLHSTSEVSDMNTRVYAL